MFNGQKSFRRAATRNHVILRACFLLALAAGLFLQVSGTAVAAQILIDFGSGTVTTTDAVSRTWNNIGSANDLTGSPFTLQNIANVDSGYRLSISNPAGVTNPVGFNGENGNGTLTPTGTAAARNYAASATRDSLFGNTTPFGTPSAIVQAVRLTLTNLNPNELYSLAFFASRTGAGGDIREAEYFITGGNTSSSIFLNASENTGNIAELVGISPNGSNQIIIDIDRGPLNNNSSGFFYLGVMEINTVAIPEPSMLVCGGCSLLGLLGLTLRRRRQHLR
jgi:hypothetical protein